MESLKKPETIVALSALAGCGGTYFYLSKRLNTINDRVNEFDKHLSAVIKKLTESSKFTGSLGDNLREVSNVLDKLNSSVRSLENSIYDLKDENDITSERLTVLFEAVKELGAKVEDPLD